METGRLRYLRQFSLLPHGWSNSSLFTGYYIVSTQMTTSGLNPPMAEIALSSQESTTCFRFPTTSVLRKRGGRPCKVLRKFRGNQYTKREEASISLDDPSDSIPPKSKRIQYTTLRYGYISSHATPFPYRKQETLFKKASDVFFQNSNYTIRYATYYILFLIYSPRGRKEM